MITARQIQAARALLKWEATDLAERSGLSRETISKIENDHVQPHEQSLAKITRAFSENGIEFLDNSGVRLKPRNIETFEGAAGFSKFYEFVYEHLRRHGGNICVSGVNEKMFVRYRPEGDAHRIRMTELAKQREEFRMQILVREGDYNFTATAYAQYRWQQKAYFSPTPFYVFGDCLALISFAQEPSPLVIVVHSAPFAEAYRQAFNFAWLNACDPPLKTGHPK